MNNETEIIRTLGGWQLVVSNYGASLRGLYRLTANGEREPVITGYSGAAGKVGGEGDVLIPFPGRIAGGRYTFDGQAYRMEQNDKDGPNAIHGFLRTVLWEQEPADGAAVRFGVSLEANNYAAHGYPFSLRAQILYTLTEDGLRCAFEIRNSGDRFAPVAAGFHPYFTAGSSEIDGDLLQVPMEQVLEFDQELIPTGRVLPVGETPFDFRQARPIGSLRLNTCFLGPRRDPDGLLRVRLTSSATGRTVAVWMDGAFDYVVLFSGDPLPESHRRRALAIEPMTCASDGFNHSEWGLVRLAPGESFGGAWGVSLEEAGSRRA